MLRGNYLATVDEKGRVMEEGSLGQLASRFRWGWFLANCFLNFLLLAAAFVAGWLILRFQWPGMPQDKVLNTIRLLGEQVIPKFR